MLLAAAYRQATPAAKIQEATPAVTQVTNKTIPMIHLMTTALSDLESRYEKGDKTFAPDSPTGRGDTGIVLNDKNQKPTDIIFTSVGFPFTFS